MSTMYSSINNTVFSVVNYTVDFLFRSPNVWIVPNYLTSGWLRVGRAPSGARSPAILKFAFLSKVPRST